MKKFLISIFIIFTVSNLFGGAWTMPKGKIYTRIAYNYYYSNEEFTFGGGKKDMDFHGRFRDYNFSLYAEYGITDRLTILTSLYFKQIKKEDRYVKITTNGIGDIDLGLKLNIFKGPKGVFSIQGLVKIPEAYDEDDALPLGNGQYDYEIRGLMGFSLWPKIPGYLNLEFGYRWRTEEPADELRYLLEFGMDFTKKFYGRIKLDGIKGLGNGKEDKDIAGNPTLSYNYDLGKLDITFGYKITKNTSIELEYTPEIYGQNTSAGATYTFAISCSF